MRGRKQNVDNAFDKNMFLSNALSLKKKKKMQHTGLKCPSNVCIAVVYVCLCVVHVCFVSFGNFVCIDVLLYVFFDFKSSKIYI